MRRLSHLLLIFAFVGCEAVSDISIPPRAEQTRTVAHSESSSSDQSALTICSFNIQFLGNSRYRDDEALARLVAGYDIVVVQELVSPPYAGNFPDGSPFKPDPESAEFFEAMNGLGFKYILSAEDTGTSDTIHRNGSSTEWWVAFFNPRRVQRATDLPNGFLASDRSNHDHYERVPHAFGFRAPDGGTDFVLISVHLKPGSSSKDQMRRQEELNAIALWIDTHDEVEKDFIILGDMNIEDAEELASVTPTGFLSLNDECRPTNTNISGPKPYDHVMFSVNHSTEIDQSFDFQVIDLISAMRDHWTAGEPYPGEPYNHNEFRKHYSDHHPVVFRISTTGRDDDGTPVVAGSPSKTIK